MKLAKVEAEKEITRYRAEQDQAFEAANTQADDSEETKRLELIYQKKLDALSELKQSLLKKAFAGEL